MNRLYHSIPELTPSFVAYCCFSSGIFRLWEFLKVVRSQLIGTAVVSIIAVTLVTLIFIPHWSAVCFVFPLVCVLFIDLIGVMQWAGLHLNPVSYVCCKSWETLSKFMFFAHNSSSCLMLCLNKNKKSGLEYRLIG
jgi:Patched family